MTVIQLDRTAPFELIPLTPISQVNDHQGRLIRQPQVEVPGLAKHNGGQPVMVDGTVYDIEEIGHDWVAVHVDFDYDGDLHYYGNHNLSEGPLRELLPNAYPLPAYPATKREAMQTLRRMIGAHDLGGWIMESDLRSSKALYVQPPKAIWNDQEDLDRYFAILNEYMPFQADVRWVTVEGHSVIRVRPTTERISA